MCNDRLDPCDQNTVNHIPEIHRSSPGRCFHQQLAVTMKQEITRFKPFLEKVVQHVFRSKLQFNASGPLGFESLELFTDIGRLVRDILHKMGRTPYGLHALFFHERQYRQRIFLGGDTIIHTIKDMRMIIRKALHEACIVQTRPAAEKTEHHLAVD